jgi:predicted O-methyltransferase YrrM
MARPGCKIITLEGDPLIAEYARKLHKSLDLKNTKIVVGPFEQTLESVIDPLSALDFVFIDGNHNGKATLENFGVIKPKLQSHSIVVIDDVFWSNDMKACWNQLKNDNMVTASLLYYDLGLLFFNEIFHEPIHINWVDRWLKPWTCIHSI